MKKKLALLLALLFFLSGCSIIERGKGANDKGLKDTTDIQYISSYSSMYDSTLVKKSNGGLLFVDLVNGVKVYACNQPGCQHTGGEDSNCLAFPNKKRGDHSFTHPFVYKNQLYYFSETYEGKIRLNRSELDGSNYTIVYEQDLDRVDFEQDIYILVDAIRVENKLYYWIKETKTSMTDDGWQKTDAAILELFEGDLDTGKCRKLIDTGEYFDVKLNGFYYSDQVLYSQLWKQNKSWDDTPYAEPSKQVDAWRELSYEGINEMLAASSNVSIYHLDSEEHQLKEVGNMFLLGVVKDRLFFWYSEGVLKTFDSNMENEQLVFTCETDIQLYNIGDKILLKYFDIHLNTGLYYRWDTEEEEFIDLGYREDYSLLILDYSKDKLWIALTPMKQSSSSSEWHYILADKEDFFKGKLNYIKIEDHLTDID
jgi:hypothetical protein